MRRESADWVPSTRMPLRQRFGIIYVQSGSDSPLVQSLHQRFRFDRRPPMHSPTTPRLHPGQELGTKQMTLLRSQRHVQDHNVGRGQHLLQIADGLNSLVCSTFRYERTSLRTEKTALRFPRPIDPYPTIRTTASATSCTGAAGFLILAGNG
jgi:hypothetical protein